MIKLTNHQKKVHNMQRVLMEHGVHWTSDGTVLSILCGKQRLLRIDHLSYADLKYMIDSKSEPRRDV